MITIVIGLGSMGKRRIRNLLALGSKTIVGIDSRLDRRKETEGKYAIPTFESLDEAVKSVGIPNVVVVALPPDLHMNFAHEAVSLGAHCFIEASVVDQHLFESLQKLADLNGLLVAPSCTMRYFPGPSALRKVIQSGILGKVFHVTYHVGQHLEEWHPWESIDDYYVSNPETGGCREIVPFELTWLSELFGKLVPLTSTVEKISSLNAPIADIYQFTLKSSTGLLASVVVDVFSTPNPVREIRVTGENGQFTFDYKNFEISVDVNGEPKTVIAINYENPEDGYINPDSPYLAELGDFFKAIEEKDWQVFPNTLAKDKEVLDTLNRIESLAK